MKIPEYIEANGEVKDNKVIIYKRREFIDTINVYNNKKIIIRVYRKHSKRSLEQNSFFHSLLPFLREVLKDSGNIMTLDETKEFFKGMFLKEDICNSDGEVIGSQVKHTSSLNKSQMADFIQDIDDWLKHYFNCSLPPANKDLDIKF